MTPYLVTIKVDGQPPQPFYVKVDEKDKDITFYCKDAQGEVFPVAKFQLNPKS